MTARPSPVDVIADWLAGEDAWCLDLPSNCRGAGWRVVTALVDAGYSILPSDGPTAPATPRTARIEHGDTWTIRDGRQVIIASHRWPAPKPGTHESDLPHINWPGWPGIDDEWDVARWAQWQRGAVWSRANTLPVEPYPDDMIVRTIRANPKENL